MTCACSGKARGIPGARPEPVTPKRADRISRMLIIQGILRSFSSIDHARKLFCDVLNYHYASNEWPVARWPDGIQGLMTKPPTFLADHNGFKILYGQLSDDSLLRSAERHIIQRLYKDDPTFRGLLIFSDRREKQWEIVNIKTRKDDSRRMVLRRMRVGMDAVRTATERLATVEIGEAEESTITPEEIDARHEKAFQVEPVTKAFYRELANWYFWAREHSVFPKDAPVDADGKPSLPLIRLITRLIFCWFLREKKNPKKGEGLLPDVLFNPLHIHDLLVDPSSQSCSYYTAILQNLFFATLNTEMDKPGQSPNRRFIDQGDGHRSNDHMIHTYWRHASQLRDPKEFTDLIRNAPFLNGGLFECLDDRVQKGNSLFTQEVRIDGFSTDPKKQPRLPNFLFFGEDQIVDLSTAYGDASRSRETVSPLLSILRKYNFTLAENTPLEQEVALDPELLGHVFENLLAAYNPETGTIARKATGSFYTPRIVVDWMVDQALMLYLQDVIPSGGKVPTLSEDRLRRLLSWEESGHDFSPEETEALIDAIDRLKVLDPACGSGAFPMGLLQKLVLVLKKLDPENKSWRNRQEAALSVIESPTAREEALHAIERAFARDNDDYGRKLYLIEKCLYGVDIQPIACQIAKLRFFISLVVDQTIDPNETNYGILPLPNLETKIVAANTVLGLYRGQLLLGSERVGQIERQLQKVRHDYFTARSYKDKKNLRNRDQKLCEELSTALSSCGECTAYDSNRLAHWNPYDTNKEASFFDPGWMFGIIGNNAGGPFDIVIGNPPYVRQEELKSITVTGSDGQPRALKDALKGQYECYTGTADLYVYFFERSLQLLRTGGVLSFITSNKYFRAAYGERLRTYLSYATRPHVVLDFGDAPLFTSIAYPCILVTRKTRHIEKGQLPSSRGQMGVLHESRLAPEDWKIRVLAWKHGPELDLFPELFDQQADALPQRDLKPDGWRLESPLKLRLLERLSKTGVPLEKYIKGRFYRGIVTGLNKAFVVDRATCERLIAEHSLSADVLKPFLRGRDVKRWRCEPQDLWLIFTRRGCDIKKYPAIYEYLNHFKDKLTPGVPGGRKPGSYKWYEIQDNIAYWQEFERPKVVYPNICARNEFAWDSQAFYVNQKAFIIPEASGYLLAYLNSSIVMWLFTQLIPRLQNGFFEPGSKFMRGFPIPPASISQQRLCERLVEALIYLHSTNSKRIENETSGLMVSYFEQWLNGLIYELFFPDELHARKLRLFEETEKMNPPHLANVSESQKLNRLKELFGKAYASNGTLRAMLYDLSLLEPVRMIEDLSEPTAEPSVEDIT